MLKTKAFSTVFIDSNHAQEELELLLATFGETKPTKNMEVIEPVKEEKIKEVLEEKTKNKISKLTDEQKAIVEDKYLAGKMSASEIADLLKVAQLSVTNYIKQLTAK
jgi:DNA-directed RNA polymerase specialized sigma subunit